MKTKYEQVAEVLERKIRSREFASGGYLPGERVLARELGVGRVTVRSGTSLLVQKNLIQPVNGNGFMVILGQSAPARRKTYLIGGVFAGSRGDAISPSSLMAEEAARTLEYSDYHLVFASSELRLDREMQTIRGILDKGVDGLIVMPVYRKLPDSDEYEENGNQAELKALSDSGLPIVLADRSYATPGIPCVCNDDEAGGYMAAKYLLDRGHRKLDVFMGAWDRVGRRRIEGCRRAVGETAGAHVRVQPISNPLSAGNFMLGLDETRAALQALDGATGIVTTGKFARQIARLVGAGEYTGPAIEWIGYDVQPDESDPTAPSFPYLSRPLAAIGRRAAEKALALIRGDAAAATEEFLKPEIVLPDMPGRVCRAVK